MAFFGLPPARAYNLISRRCFAHGPTAHILQPLCICVRFVCKLRTGYPPAFSGFVDPLICWHFGARTLLWDDAHVRAAPMFLSYCHGQGRNNAGIEVASLQSSSAMQFTGYAPKARIRMKYMSRDWVPRHAMKWRAAERVDPSGLHVRDCTPVVRETSSSDCTHLWF